MRKLMLLVAIAGHAVSTAASCGATASFTPIGPSDVEAGTAVVYELSVSVSTLSGFDSADVIIGSDGATDVTFTYSADWTASFANVTTPVFDTGFYAQDVFVGGNNATAVGTSLVVGTVAVSTTGMAPGSYSISVDHARDGVSTLGLAGVPESLNGSGGFTILESPQACCAANACSIDPPSVCLSGGGTPKGQGTTCADGNSNGIADVCEACTCQLFGDITPPGGDCDVNLDDILYVLDAFAAADPCVTFPGSDLFPCEDICGLTDLDDILAVLDAFAGIYGCPHPCPP